MRPRLGVKALALTALVVALVLIALSQRGVGDPDDYFARSGDRAGDRSSGPSHGVAAPTAAAPPMTPTAPRATPLDPARAEPAPLVRAPGRWVLVRPGRFTRGSPADEVGRHDNEVQREVTLTRAFLIQTTEVTQGQFRDVMGYDPSEFARCGRDCPVEQVSWHDAAAYCNAISDQEGLGRCYSCRGEEISVFCTPSTAYATPYDCPGYRLPTEAEWELAARAGRATALYGELAAIAWYAGNSDASYAGAFDCSDGRGGVREAATCGPHPVGLKRRNECGLHDVLGNVWEWCHDFYAEGRAESAATDPVGPGPAIARVFRGGSWDNDAGSLRLARRNGGAPGTRFVDVGFRSARTAPRR